jgi:hypothetical protein
LCQKIHILLTKMENLSKETLLFKEIEPMEFLTANNRHNKWPGLECKKVDNAITADLNQDKNRSLG